ncbi:cell division ATP-binding protein FtsE [Alkalithermobacter thermoalcaliphilus JW-YL-7 = DSM 7308]|uniref:Cell division ATP-binding protein FtsE n=1 Tax=Alkalithermobacter thermoalcaliphilus JW-YL-7 = DSM 7308 TaxID=1121328 RepID=A0A150FSE1_CLOPD|nr:cell division ATP-binding protein FtsE [[Clostridium] paradoxum JW-YL-7 = DSM 7308]SHK72844.1 cell division ATP-binding protein FtsE [[Clostridium] paradoxum JW-YL-7 = DSM 7308]
MIEFIDVKKIYKNDKIALSNINLKIDKGEFVFLIGSSGAGKSTFMKLLLKEEEVTSGKLIIDGVDITKLPRRKVPKLRRSMGIVFQDFRLLQNKNVYDNVAFAMEITGHSQKEIRRKVPSVLSLVGLSDKAKSYPSELSGGEQQRVSIARAIVNNPSLLIADEPTGNLDPQTAWEIMELLKDINKRGTTVIMATHAKDVVDKLKKRVIALEKGVIVRDEERGTYDE